MAINSQCMNTFIQARSISWGNRHSTVYDPHIQCQKVGVKKPISNYKKWQHPTKDEHFGRSNIMKLRRSSLTVWIHIIRMAYMRSSTVQLVGADKTLKYSALPPLFICTKGMQVFETTLSLLILMGSLGTNFFLCTFVWQEVLRDYFIKGGQDPLKKMCTVKFYISCLFEFIFTGLTTKTLYHFVLQYFTIKICCCRVSFTLKK